MYGLMLPTGDSFSHSMCMGYLLKIVAHSVCMECYLPSVDSTPYTQYVYGLSTEDSSTFCVYGVLSTEGSSSTYSVHGVILSTEGSSSPYYICIWINAIY